MKRTAMRTFKLFTHQFIVAGLIGLFMLHFLLSFPSPALANCVKISEASFELFKVSFNEKCSPRQRILGAGEILEAINQGKK